MAARLDVDGKKDLSEPAWPRVAGRPTEIRIHRPNAQLPPKTGLLIRRTLLQDNIFNTTIVPT
ncbi:3bb617ec-e21e-456c-b8c1-fa832d8b7efe [Thermothielavioides terrestris]|uniref:3bb617ec-e21e-456c-b8c1-fa832d8b7efe n=1 Tax=Thermothielavioides terrestris TaxID=2587410 RepID=A0A446B6N1_9PEZI|nr:3bb617ec-e21e-456c-b8c1-fa832d8b7efe [Thermothielavioides terrestris]